MSQPTDFRDKVALITGAGSGLGRELARKLSEEGAAIAAVDRRAEGLTSLHAELTGAQRRMAWAVVDVTDFAALHEAVGKLADQLGPIDLLIASAGIGLETSALCLYAEDMAAVIQVNLIGVANSIAAVLPAMLKRRQGHIVAISSLASFRGVPRMLGYCASKAGVNALMEGLRVEVKPYDVAATTICPGWIRTPMTANIRGPMPQLMDVGLAARHILGAIRRRERFFAFPRALAWRLRVLGWLPASISDWMISSMLRKLETS
jgi:short-subunit dehydrogenase